MIELSHWYSRQLMKWRNMRLTVSGWTSLNMPSIWFFFFRVKHFIYIHWYARAIYAKGSDMEYRFCIFLDQATGTMSKANYSTTAMAQELSDKQQKDYAIAYDDALDDSAFKQTVLALEKAERGDWMHNSPTQPFVPSDDLARAKNFAKDC